MSTKVYINRPLVTLKWMSENVEWLTCDRIRREVFGAKNHQHTRHVLTQLVKYGLVEAKINEKQRILYRSRVAAPPAEL
jgi:hypothetical protein